jgi:hypothetical protein
MVGLIMSFEDYVISLPKKIDFIHYSAGSGGEFLSSLIALSCSKTKNLINQTELTLEPGLGDYIHPTYISPNYFLKSLKTCMEHIDLDMDFMTGEEIIKSCKSSIYSSMMFYYSKYFKKNKDIFYPYLRDETAVKNKLETLYKDITIIICKHFHIINENKVSDLNSTKIWDVINIDPITKEGRKCVNNSVRVIFRNKRLNPRFSDKREYRTPGSDIERFPFFDYMIYEDYDGVKYFLENRYGSNLDFDFIDRSLKDYYQIRVKPYLK